MRAPADLAPRRRRSSVRVAAALVVVALVFVLLSLRGIAGFYTDYLWFDELGITPVWRQVLGAKIMLGVIFTIVFFVVMWANLAIADLLAPRFRPAGAGEELIERYHQAVGARAGLVRGALAGVFALIAGPGAAGQWNNWILFRNHVAFSAHDEQFAKDIGFYVFDLPFLTFVVDWLFATFVIVVVLTAVAHYLNGGIRFQAPMEKVTPQVKAHLSVLMAVLALLKAVGYYLERYELVYSTRGVVQGAGYTDVNAQLPALHLLFWISLFACGLFLINILRRGWILPVISLAVWALVSVVVGGAIPAFVQQFRVQPTESTKERPYIDRNIKATKAAFNIHDVAVRDFAANDQLTGADLLNDAEVVRNIRLWDPLVAVRSYQRLEERRNFYRINDVDVDRYRDVALPNQNVQVLMALRELRLDGIPSQSWVNRHLVYTHGYGAVMSAGNGVEADGNPLFSLRDLPPTGEPVIERPEIYYGENLSGYAIVKSDQREIDFTNDDGSISTSVYEGSGGVEMSSWLRRVALSLRFGDLNPLISDFINPDSRAMYIRDIHERVRKAAPFLRFDSDPYPVIYRDGIHWVYDAYTTTSRYPYSQRADTGRLSVDSGLTGNFNYVRNSVKVVIDAYHGSMTFYVTDPSDPIVQAYRKAFPRLFTDGARMDSALRAHLRYPEDLFRVQTNMYGMYHIDDPAAFYNRTDAWEIAQEPGELGGTAAVSQLAPNGQTPANLGPRRENRMDPYYLQMRPPGSATSDFVILQPFVPFSRDDSRKDLSAFMVGRGDPANYGQLEAYVTPRQRPVNGPALINSRIQADAEVSREITLLSQQGSNVSFGNMLLVPIGQSLLWVRPLYVEAEGATPLPQLRKVIVVFGERVVMADTLRQSLVTLFGDAPPTLERAPAASNPPVGSGVPPPGGAGAAVPQPTLLELLGQAEARFAAAEEALRRGDLAGYQRETLAARDAIRRAQELATTAPPPATTPTTRVGA
ncbi:MAG TPA: UPF0182 family protein [Egibacteraceae bacterium]|nr:UPF0182 family protein [Egibacteraceae bacterium]